MLCMCLPIYFCYKSITILVLDLFKSICIYLGMMQRSHTQIWHNLGFILRTCGGINDVNVVLLINTLYVTKSSTLNNPPLSHIIVYKPNINLHWHFWKNIFNLILGLKQWQHRLIHIIYWHCDDKVSIK